mgnify:CR=1 FL=1
MITKMIAVDDIRLKNECEKQNAEFCDFEAEDICGYQVLPGSNPGWQRGSPRNDSDDFPITDHTTGTDSGYFMYASGVLIDRELRALLASNDFRINSADKCLQFFFHQPANFFGDLNVYIKQSDVNLTNLLPIWSDKFDIDFYGVVWRKSQIQIQNLHAFSFQVIFEQYVESILPGNKYGVFIDDVQVKESYCLKPEDCDFENGDTCESIATFYMYNF